MNLLWIMPAKGANMVEPTSSRTPLGTAYTVVVSSGTRPLPSLPPGRLIAADGGLTRCIAAGIRPDVVIGDFDSVDPDLLAEYKATGGTVHRFPTDKNATDLELALDLVAPGSNLIVVGGDGLDRFDHLLGELAHLTSRARNFSSLAIHYPPSVIYLSRPGQAIQLEAPVGTVVSLIPLSARTRRVTTSGLRWPLKEEDLMFGSTRGLSNEFAEPYATVTTGSGTLLVVLPVAPTTPKVSS
jgi:thiamine pyrophosphokinase